MSFGNYQGARFEDTEVTYSGSASDAFQQVVSQRNSAYREYLNCNGGKAEMEAYRKWVNLCKATIVLSECL